MTTSYTDFIKEHLQSSPHESEWISVFTSPEAFDVMELVRSVKAEGHLCQILLSEQADALSPKLLVQMAETFISHGVVVILQCSSQEDLFRFSKDIEEWKLRTVNSDEKSESPRGRFWILLQNTPSESFTSQLQGLADYSCQV